MSVKVNSKKIRQLLRYAITKNDVISEKLHFHFLAE